MPEIDITFHDEFYLRYLYGEDGRSASYISQYIKELERLVNKYPAYSDLRNKLGIAYVIQCRQIFSRALSEFQKATSIDPEYERAQKNLKLAHNDGKGLLILLRALLK